MKVLFLSLSPNVDLEDTQAIYGSLLHEIVKRGNDVYVVTPSERKNKQKTSLITKNHYNLLKVKTGNIQKTNIIEKGISTLLIEKQYKKAILKYFKNLKFDLILYATPPITFYSVISYFKKRDNSKTYLMLKDIFPQNAVDLKMFKKSSIIYKYFRKKEKKLYMISDIIGCMSPKNKEFLINNNNYIDKNKIEIFPNSIIPKKENIRNKALNEKYRDKYNIPYESKVFMYGGNLGKPQGIPFIIKCIVETKNIDDIYYVICGTGTEFKKIENYIKENKIDNILLLNGLPKKEYNELLNIADIGLIFLDYNFTIPNFPSRLLSYMEKSIPILSCTDPNTDIGEIIEKNHFGWKCYSNNANEYKKKVEYIMTKNNEELDKIGKNGLLYLYKNYNSSKNIDKILKKLKLKI